MKRKSSITNRFDLPGAVQTGWHEEEGKDSVEGKRRKEGESCDLGSFHSPLSRQLASFLPAALSFGPCGCSWRSGIERKNTTIEQETDKRGRQMHLEAEVSQTAETHQFVNSNNFHLSRNFNPLASQFSVRLSVCFFLHIVHNVGAKGRSFPTGKADKWPLMPNKSNWILPYRFPFQTIQKHTLIPVKLSSIYLYPAVILPPLFICYWSTNNSEWADQQIMMTALSSRDEAPREMTRPQRWRPVLPSQFRWEN